jgi:hypothetical protein
LCFILWLCVNVITDLASLANRCTRRIERRSARTLVGFILGRRRPELVPVSSAAELDASESDGVGL